MSNPVYADGRTILYQGDCREVMATLGAGWADAVITDPPYELKFMGKGWDDTGVAFDVETWKRCYALLKPGGHLLAFGGTRTWHRMACAIEDAGFELRDSIAWLYDSGFPKSMDVSKAIDKAAGATREVIGQHANPAGNKPGGASLNMSLVGMPETADITAPATDAAKQWQGWGTALKPAFEPIVVARKPLGEKTVAANVLTYGTGAINIDACRVETNEDRSRPPRTPNQLYGGGKGTNTTASESHVGGRWPANVLLDGEMADALDEQSGNRPSSKPIAGYQYGSGEHTYDESRNAYGTGLSRSKPNSAPYGDSGGASRFFPVFRYQAKAPTKERPKVDGVAHPTVKPLDLMRWLIKLVVPTPGDAIVLDPFAGSGTTLEAAMLENVRSIGIEGDEAHIPLIMQRLSRVKPT